MAVTSGFFNSNAGDRKYNAEQMSAIFDGIINDGVLANIGTAFSVKASSGNTLNVGIGRAWFNSIWIYNDSIMPITLDEAELVLDRIDALVFEVNKSQEVRNATIKFVTGTPASSPKRPTMVSTDYIHQYPLAYILRPAGSTSITQGNITNAIGTSETPYVTGILQVQNIDNIVAQWSAQWVEWFAFETGKTESEANDIIKQWTQWYQEFSFQSSAEFTKWFESLQAILDGDVATNLANGVLKLNEKFDILAEEGCIYVSVEDSDDDPICDSDGNPIEGKTVFTPTNSGDNLVPNIHDQEGNSYKALFLLDKWEGSGPYTQTAVVISVSGGPAITEQSRMVSSCFADDSLCGQTAILDAAAIVDSGIKTFGAGTMTCQVDQKPTADAEVYFFVMKGDE